MERPRDPWAERRQLIEYLLKDADRYGTQVRCPPGHTSFSALALLDSLDTELLLQQLQRQRGAVLDLAKCRRPSASGAAPPSASSFSGPTGTVPRPPLPPSSASVMVPAAGAAAGMGGPPIYNLNLPAGMLQVNGNGNGNGVDGSNPFGPVPDPAAGGGHRSRAPSGTGTYGSPAPAAAASPLPPPPPLPTPALPAAVPDPMDLGLQQLRTGLEEGEVRDLAFSVFVACIQGEMTAVPLTEVMRAQLQVDAAVAAQVQAAAARLTSDGTLNPVQRVSLEGAVRALERVRPADFGADLGPGKGQSQGQGLPPAFLTFRRWQRSQAAVVRSGFQRNVEDSWAAADWAAARKLLARLRASLRRLDCPTPDDLDEEEYSEAVAALTTTARHLAGSCRAGWQLPWGTRVRVAELLLSAMFDRVDPSCQVDEATALTSVLERCVWPVLGVGPVLQQGVAAWVYFKQYLITRDARQLRQLKYLMSKVLTQTEVTPLPSDAFNLGQDVVATDANRRDAGWDHELASHVAQCIVTHCADRLADYYAAFPDASTMQGLLDVLAFASRSRGDDDAQLSRQLAGLVRTSTEAELRRRADRLQRGGSASDALLALVEAAQQLHQQQQPPAALSGAALGAYTSGGSGGGGTAVGGGGGYAQVIEGQLPGALLLSDAAMYGVVGKQLLPWLEGASNLDTPTLHLLRAALALDSSLGPGLQQAASAVEASASAAAAAAAAAAGNNSAGGAAAGGLAAYPPIPMPDKGAVAAAGSGNRPSPSLLPPAALSGKSALLPTLGPLLGFQRWDLGTALRRCLQPWVATRVQDLTTWTNRQLGQEQWKPVGREHGTAQVAIEVVRMCEAALDAAFGLGLPLPRDAVQALLIGMDSVLTRVATFISTHVGSTARLIPPRPPPTRFKRDVVSAQEAAELAARTGKPPPGSGSNRLLSALSGKKDKKVPELDQVWLASVPRIQASPDYTNIHTTLTRQVLLTCCQSAAYLRDQADRLAAVAADRWQAQAGGRTPASPPSPDTTSWARQLMEPCRTALEGALEHTLKFMASKVVFWELRQQWLEELYRHHVASARITDVLDLTNSALGDVCTELGPALQARFAAALLQACTQALEWVLLDGGPCRWYTPADVQLLEQDMGRLKELFHAGGHGLPKDVIDAELQRLVDLLRPMALELGPLIELLKEAQERGSCTMQAKVQPLVFSEAVIMRVLARRPERAGSKLLKDKYKLGKRPK